MTLQKNIISKMFSVAFFLTIFVTFPICLADHPYDAEEDYDFTPEPLAETLPPSEAMIDARFLYKNQREVPEPNFIKASTLIS